MTIGKKSVRFHELLFANSPDIWYTIQNCVAEDLRVGVSYKKLWKLLIDRDLKKQDLEKAAGISHYTMNKLYHGENVTTDVLVRVCTALNVSMDEILEIVPKNN